MYRGLREQREKRILLILLAVIVIAVSLSVAGVSMLMRGQESFAHGGGSDGESDTESSNIEGSPNHIAENTFSLQGKRRYERRNLWIQALWFPQCAAAWYARRTEAPQE